VDFPFADLRLAPSNFSSPVLKVCTITTPSYDIDAEKALHRAAARADRDALSSGLGAAAAAGIAARFMTAPALVERTGIGTMTAGYMPIGSEIDPRGLMEQLAARGSGLCLPDVVSPEAPLEFRRWTAGDVLRSGAYGIEVPMPDADRVHPDVVLVPMLAFNRRGYRLGYGGGYYDRTIAALRETKTVLTVGVAFSGQVRDDLPVGPHDVHLDWIVTESAALRVTD
jgi:5-formyltetrahydrofolate cyclo-ligase